MSQHDASILAAFAPAKVNLTLRVGTKRPDGYHDLESLVVFADCGDALQLTPGSALSLTSEGATAAAAGPHADNLVLKAAQALADAMPQLNHGHFHLAKSLPVAAGLGGGSSDAAAALRLLAQANKLAADDARLFAAARASGADVAVCLDPRPRIMRGIGDRLSAPLALAPLHAVLINPGAAVATGKVFAAFDAAPGQSTLTQASDPGDLSDAARLHDYLRAHGNDLERAACALCPVIDDVLAALRAAPGCRLARMSGSGATCFGLFESQEQTQTAAQHIIASHAGWWVRPVRLGDQSAAGEARIQSARAQ